MTTTTKKITSEIRFCDDIGLFVMDRKIETSCVHRSEYCKVNCYNNKLMAAFSAIDAKDDKCEKYWKDLDGKEFTKVINRKRKDTKRFRFCTRGEALSVMADIKKIKDIVNSNKDVNFWVPTRAWRNAEMRKVIITELLPIPNLFIQASTDPSNTQVEVDQLHLDGFRMMFFGNDKVALTPKGIKPFKCPKTWVTRAKSDPNRKFKPQCAGCLNGCFGKDRGSKSAVIWLKQH